MSVLLSWATDWFVSYYSATQSSKEKTKLLQLLCIMKKQDGEGRGGRLDFICTQNEHPQSAYSVWE